MHTRRSFLQKSRNWWCICIYNLLGNRISFSVSIRLHFQYHSDYIIYIQYQLGYIFNINQVTVRVQYQSDYNYIFNVNQVTCSISIRLYVQYQSGYIFNINQVSYSISIKLHIQYKSGYLWRILHPILMLFARTNPTLPKICVRNREDPNRMTENNSILWL